MPGSGTRRHSEDFRNAALDLIRERYLDFGPTLARVTANRPLLDGFEEERECYRQRLAEYPRRLSSYQSRQADNFAFADDPAEKRGKFA
ncbi:hypothetical protein GFM01_34860 [Rhizobium laguerreae]|uniref:Uncharacterized protein n=1 Tax=Rhizobium laguerreae TaxID=1076926 RepID=A0AAX2QEJ6_9HYPH|nr:hypothetical protein [Rhizobium laguerreae]NKM22823.1 hypothetical protein [Rhizobium laguerreae]NKM32137.1 hypothetical protein [Rhizobium laguerreae]NKM42693.1 hypothetical protein [Rhizobium laguerreae]TCU19577.1 hypothetical protein EV131_113177 [Rhizobium laguerreae]